MVYTKIKKIRILFIVICIAQLLHIFQFRSGFHFEVIKNPFKVDSGVSLVVSSEVIEISEILKNQKVKSFNLSKIIKNNSYLHKKSVEYNYPIIIDENSKMIFFLKDENIPDSCKVVETRKYFKFTKC